VEELPSKSSEECLSSMRSRALEPTRPILSLEGREEQHAKEGGGKVRWGTLNTKLFARGIKMGLQRNQTELQNDKENRRIRIKQLAR